MLTSSFVGDPYALKYARRELPVIDVVCRYVRGRSCVVQAGGNLGVFPKRLAELFTRVITFEPDADNFAALRRNACEPNIEARRAALGASQGFVGLSKFRRDGKSNHHAGVVHVSGDGDVPMTTIDWMGLSECDAILLDVEGYELYALRGARETVRRCRPVIAAEINKSLRYVGLTENDVLGFFKDQGYLFVEHSGSDRIFVPLEHAGCH